MEKQIIWTKRILTEIEQILDYWNERNQSNEYSLRLLKRFEAIALVIFKNPLSGKPTTNHNIRVFMVSHYLVFYEWDAPTITLLTVFDSRRNPDFLPFYG